MHTHVHTHVWAPKVLTCVCTHVSAYACIGALHDAPMMSNDVLWTSLDIMCASWCVSDVDIVMWSVHANIWPKGSNIGVYSPQHYYRHAGAHACGYVHMHLHEPKGLVHVHAHIPACMYRLACEWSCMCLRARDWPKGPNSLALRAQQDHWHASALCSHVCTHARAHLWACAGAHTCVHARVHVHTHVPMCLRADTWAHACAHACLCMHSCMCTGAHGCVHPCAHVHVRRVNALE